MSIKAKIESNELVITVRLPINPRVSSTGKTLVIGSEQMKNATEYNGQPVTIGINAYTGNTGKIDYHGQAD